MKRTAITLLVLAAITTVRATTNGQGALYPFEIDTLLTCYSQVNSVDGTFTIAPEPPLRLPFGRRVQQGMIERVFLPQDTLFRQPAFQLTRELEERLLRFLREDPSPASELLTSVNRPIRDPPRACDILPAFEGSAGQTKQHVEVVEETWSLAENREFSDTYVSTLNPIVSRPISSPEPPPDPTTSEFLINRVLPGNFNGLSFTDRSSFGTFINDIEEMCPLWIAKCPLSTVWAELPQTFFPRYFAQGTCSGKNCSYPRGLHCEEDFTYSVYVNVLRWDCCYNAFLGQLRWDCGWRKVQIPILCDCTCGCGPVFPNRRFA